MKEVLTVIVVLLLLGAGLWQWRNMNRSTKLGERRRFVLPLDAETLSEAIVILPYNVSPAEWGQFLESVMVLERGVVQDAEPELEVDDDALEAETRPRGFVPKDQPARGRRRRTRFQGSGGHAA